jgi:DNA adenine methylase
VLLNAAVFDTGRPHAAWWGDVFALPEEVRVDLVYIDPPYVGPHSDNDYTRRYHFVEGLARGWQGVEIQPQTATRKFRRLPSRFDRKATVYDAFRDLFQRFAASILVVSYSSNGIPSREEMVALLREAKREVTVYTREHRYSFGTHGHRVGANHNRVEEYLFVGR